MTVISDLSPGLNVISPSAVDDIDVAGLFAQRCGYGALTTGGEAGNVYVVSSLADSGPNTLRDALSSPDPLWIVFNTSGIIPLASALVVTANKTIDGVGQDIIISKHRTQIQNVTNVILHNLSIIGELASGLVLDGVGAAYCDLIWLHHCTLADFTDGLFDVTRTVAETGEGSASRFTMSWCRLGYHDKACLAGLHLADEPHDDGIRGTYHHNYFECTQRMPRVAQGIAHCFNNVINFDQTGMASYDSAKLLAEANWVRASGAAKGGAVYALTGFPDGRIRLGVSPYQNITENGAILSTNLSTTVPDPNYDWSAFIEPVATPGAKSRVLAYAGAR